MVFPMDTVSIRCDVTILLEALGLAMRPADSHATHSNETDPAEQEHSSLIIDVLGSWNVKQIHTLCFKTTEFNVRPLFKTTNFNILPLNRDFLSQLRVSDKRPDSKDTGRRGFHLLRKCWTLCIATYEQQNCLHVCRHVAHFVHVYAAYAIFFPDALSRVKTCKMIAVNEILHLQTRVQQVYRPIYCFQYYA